MDEKETRRILSANIHLDGRCNYHCAHCFDRCLPKQSMTCNKWIPYLEYLKSIGVTKINLAGGEPFLYPHLEEMCKLTRSMGFTVTIVSNGSLITEDIMENLSETIRWIGLSIDSPDEEDEMFIGRNNGRGNHIEHIITVSEWAHANGIKVKLNITVLRQSWNKDFHELIAKIKPERVKAFRVLTLKNSNDDLPDTWSITDKQYATFMDRHKDIHQMVFEDNSDMIGTYLMLDPIGRWMVNNNKEKKFVPFEQLRKNGPGSLIDVDGYYGRGGAYGWGSE